MLHILHYTYQIEYPKHYLYVPFKCEFWVFTPFIVHNVRGHVIYRATPLFSQSISPGFNPLFDNILVSFSETSLLVIIIHLLLPLSSEFKRLTACAVVPDPAIIWFRWYSSSISTIFNELYFILSPSNLPVAKRLTAWFPTAQITLKSFRKTFQKH